MHPSSASLSPAGAAPRDRGLAGRLEKSEIYRDYRDAFEATTGLPLAFRPAGSFQAPLHRSRQANPLCRIMAANNHTCAACLRLQQCLEDGNEGSRTTECFTGLSESSVPVRAGDSVLGHLQTGQVLLRKPTESGFRKILAQLAALHVAVDQKQLRAAYFGSRVLAKRQYEAIVRLVSIFARHLSEVGNRLVTQEAVGDSPVVAKVKAYVAANLSERLSLEAAARAVSLSVFHLCKTFKKETGLNFTDYVGRVRVEAVKEMLLNPHTRVSEAAFAAGFQSIAQFNRVFHRVTGESPSAFRERQAGSAAPHGGGLPLARAA